MARKIRQSDIALASGVSVSTVSRVLNNMPGISPEVREQVQRAAGSLGLTVAGAAPVRASASSVLVLSPMSVLSAQAGQFHTDILAGVTQAARSAGVRLTCLPIGDRGDIEAALSGFDGVILLSIDSADALAAARGRNMPLVLLNSMPEGEDDTFDAVLPDNFGGGAKACRHLHELGHRRIAFIAHSERGTIAQRFDGYRHVIGAGARSELLPLDMPVGDRAERLAALRADTGFTALVCSNDITAMGVIQALGRLGLSVPDDVSIMGFDDLPTAALSQPPLTTMRIDREALGAAAFRRLVARLAHPGEPPMRQIIATELVRRKSTVEAPTGSAARNRK